MQIDQRESLYEEVVRQHSPTRSPLERDSIATSLSLALTCDVHENFLFKPMSHYGLAKSSFNLLALLRFAHPGGLQLSQIGELLITSRANITGLVDHLEQRGYVKRIVDPHDRRARLACLTSEGEAVVDTVLPGHKRRTVAFFQTLTSEEVQQLAKLLKKLRQGAAQAETDVQELQGGDAAVFEPELANED